MTFLQLKPYLEARRVGDDLRFGNMPPRGIELESAPYELDHLIFRDGGHRPKSPRGLDRFTVSEIRRLLAIVLHSARTLTPALAAAHWRRRHQTRETIPLPAKTETPQRNTAAVLVQVA